MAGAPVILGLVVLSLSACSTVMSGAASVVPSTVMTREMCLDLDRICWGPYVPASGTFYLEVKNNSLIKYDCFAITCPNILKLADEQLKSKGWCPGGYVWDEPVWIRGVFRMNGRCVAPPSQKKI